ncbi:hypothetical protein DFH11DRAFT_1505319 [Phellopilus nigrolimitatus]|nr:hypothetical protein DFH11DRAFT_1505319 [Phellopilus nigrolimitatus]
MLECAATTAPGSSTSLTSCPTCCSSCDVERHASRFAETSVHAGLLQNILSAGTITLSLLSINNFCDHQHAEDGWHALRDVQTLRPHLSVQNSELFNALEFLLKKNFILATYRTLHVSRVIVIRVYLIPYDLQGSKGSLSLRVRDEVKVLKPARKYLRHVLAYVSKRRSTWYGEDQLLNSQTVIEPFFPPNEDQSTLGQIFNNLATTRTDIHLPEICRLRSSLFTYQRESVATMLEREEQGKTIDDPLYVPINGMMGETLYLQPASMELLYSRPRISQNRGGFLCEELGTGKTVMILALILATLDTLSQPPEHCSNVILTPLALRHFPHHNFASARSLAMKRGSAKGARKFPSLVEILCHYIRVSPENVNTRAYEDELEKCRLWKPIMNNTPFYLHVEPNFAREFLRCQPTREQPRVMYLTAATLIVVPRTLQAQWNSEILKHCSSSIRTLVIKQKTDIPPPHRLASDYDVRIVLFSLFLKGRSALANGLSALNTGYICHCPSFSHIRVPNCKCTPPFGVSSLLQVRWKRLIRDEGHNAATQSTGMNHFLELISAERRWIVTGTPTTNLLGLNFGSNAEDGIEESEMPIEDNNTRDQLSLMYKLRVDESANVPVDRMDISVDAGDANLADNDDNDGNDKNDEDEDDIIDLQYPAHIWSRADRVDVRKLGQMMASFLGVLPFAADPHAFRNHVTSPLFGSKAEGRTDPLPGATRVLEQVMSMSMVRHRIADIERSVRLPPVREETVLLDLDEYGQMTYNVMLSFIAVNAVDSERKDQDYLFHPSKTALLAQTIQNLSHSLFWRVDEDALDYELPDNIHRAEQAILHAKERGQPNEDIKLVERAITHLLKALHNPQFRSMQRWLELPYRIHHAPARTKQAWGIAHHDPQYTRENAFFMYPQYAMELRDAVMRQPLASEERLAERAALVREKDRALLAYVEARKPRSERASEDAPKQRKKRKREGTEVDKAKLGHVRRAMESKESLQEKHEEFRLAQERLKALAEADEEGLPVIIPASPSKPESLRATAEFLPMSPIAKMRVGNSTSSKLNYILDEVRKYAATEKILIFSSQLFNLVHISEGLDLLGVKYLHFMDAKQRDQWLTTFETSETYRVFLMELEHGARGLNIVSASRVIFCEPVWHADVESQAIKRVHRIGQNRPVTVKTLAIRSTFEEYMIQRRRDFKGIGSKLPGMAEEIGIRQYLENPVFLETAPQCTEELSFPLLRLPQDEWGLTTAESTVELSEDTVSMGQGAASALLALGEIMDVDVDQTRTVIYSGESIVVTPSKKRRKVRFG